ncbi:MAG TPA: amidohydrolase [Candidatus Krumholzibacteriaceae bacterium]|nr:amidohydrolase [Candidatus Krumholzibacteriaceae bacterium]
MPEGFKSSVMGADLVMVNGKVVTVDEKGTVAEAVAVKDGKIVAVGTTRQVKELANSGTNVIDLEGRLMLPGFIDTHEHCIRRGLQMDWVNCKSPPRSSLGDVTEALRMKAETKQKGEWIVGSGFDESQWGDKRFPNRHDLDKASTMHPIYLGRAGGHNSVANSLALELAGITKDTPQPPGGNIERDENGEPTGRLDEIAAMDMVRSLIPKPSGFKEIELLAENWPTLEEQYLSWGLTTIHEAHIKAPEAQAYQRLDEEGKLRIRIGLMLDGMTPYKGHATSDLSRQGLRPPFRWSDRLFVVGVKVGTDGAMGSLTAALHEDYSNDPGNKGIIRCTKEELTDEIVRCHVAGIRTCTHAIGDRAIDMTLDALEEAINSRPWPCHRHRIEHAGYVLPRQLERMAELGVNVSASIGFCYPIGDSHIAALGQDRLCGYYPMKSFRDHGIVAAGNSDGFGDNYALTGIYGCVARKSRSGNYLCKDEAVPIMDAIKVYTWNAAYLEGSEDLKGSIEPGKLADFVVLDRDITAVDPEEIIETEVLMTIVGGDVVYERSP